MGLFDGTSLERPVTCAVCGQAPAACACPKGADGAVRRPADQKPRVRREKRRGKWVTVVAALDLSTADLDELLREAKGRVSAGGSRRDDGFEVQGDHRDAVVAQLKTRGFTGVKTAGG